MAEFWNVATRPLPYKGLGYSVAFAAAEIRKIESLLTILPDSPEVYAEWKRLIVAYSVMGGKVHDTRLVATMLVHGVHRATSH